MGIRSAAVEVAALVPRECAVAGCPNAEGQGQMVEVRFWDALRRVLILCGPCASTLGLEE